MKHLSEYRDPALATRLVERISATVTRPWNIMEVCGGQTHSIVKHGLERLLPGQLRLLHGPGCPVCVTPIELIDQAIHLSQLPSVVVCSFGDMLRVPGSADSLLQARGRGAQLQLVYSPLDAVELAASQPEKHVVFFAVGFETTAPATAMALLMAEQRGLSNFSVLASHVQVPPALDALLSDPEHCIDGLLAAGHVCTIMGLQQYEPIARRHCVPVVATGFEPVDILEGILLCVQQLEAGSHRVLNQYRRAVQAQGNPTARSALEQVFRAEARTWRGLGTIQQGGLALTPRYSEFDAQKRFELPLFVASEPAECISGLVLQGKKRPADCAAFGTRCTPQHPLGAPMVSSEGACAAYARYPATGTQ